MAKKKHATESSTQAYLAAAAEARAQPYVLRLFVAGTTPGSLRAVETLRAICDEHLVGRYELQVVDVYQQPELARDEQVIVIPTLVKRQPAPARKIIGDLSERERVLQALELKTRT